MPNFVQIGRTVAEIRPFTIFCTRRPSAFLNFKKFKILIAHALRRAKMHHHAKVCANRSRRCGDMAVFDFSRWRSSAILDYQKLEILTAHTLWRAKMRHHTKFCADRSNRCRYMAVYNFSRWRRPPSWILKSSKFWLLLPFGGPMCIILPNLVQIGQGVAEIWPQKSWSQKKLKTTREWYFTHLPGRPPGTIGLNFGLLGHIADVITHAKFCDNRFRGFGVLIPPILPFSIGIAGRPYNSVNTTVLHCESQCTVLVGYFTISTYVSRYKTRCRQRYYLPISNTTHACTIAWCAQHSSTAAAQKLSTLFNLSYGPSRPELNSVYYNI